MDVEGAEPRAFQYLARQEAAIVERIDDRRMPRLQLRDPIRAEFLVGKHWDTVLGGELRARTPPDLLARIIAMGEQGGDRGALLEQRFDTRVTQVMVAEHDAVCGLDGILRSHGQNIHRAAPLNSWGGLHG